jgi:hypothetical protein
MVCKEKFGGNLIDKKFTSALIDMYIIGAKTNSVKFESKFKLDNMMVRFEFLETIVRIAKGKYGDDQTVSEAVEDLL